MPTPTARSTCTFPPHTCRNVALLTQSRSGIAENSLLVNEYIAYFGTVLKDHLTPVDLSYGNQASGSRRLHSAIADLWNEYVKEGRGGARSASSELQVGIDLEQLR